MPKATNIATPKFVKPAVPELTADEIERYEPYDVFPEFARGFNDYMAGRRQELRNVPGQAYDRGAECAMRRRRVG